VRFSSIRSSFDEERSFRGEQRQVAIGLTASWRLLFAVHVELAESIRLISARDASRAKGSDMKISKLKQRMAEKRPMTAISIRVPEDVIDDLRRVAEVRGLVGTSL